MDSRELLSIISEELSNSIGGMDSDELGHQKALSYYLGQPLGNEVTGRSKVVSTDVADAIEWILPLVMEQLTRNYNVIKFDPTYEGDEKQADLESQFVFDILMKKNNGFLILHQAVKDALLQKNGIFKTYYAQEKKFTTHRYTGLTEQEMSIILSEPDVEVLQHSERLDPSLGVPVYDIKIKRTTVEDKINVQSIPPEEFRINRDHNDPDPTKARFTAHVYLSTASDLIKSGIPREVVEGLPSFSNHDDQYRFTMQGENSSFPGVRSDDSQRLIEVSECYLHVDLDDDGVSEFVKVEVAGDQDPTEILRIEELEIDDHPFGALLCIMMSHKFYGLSIFDRLQQIQEQKTALWRNILDNLYLQNNQRIAVVENAVNLDDLLISRPGGIVRQKMSGAIEPIVTPAIGQEAYTMMEYLDQVRSSRVGVNPEGPLQIEDIGNRVGSQGVSQLLAAREAVVSLIVRVIAETGIKPLAYKIRDQARKHLGTITQYQFRGEWIPVRPADWSHRQTTTVMVGTGSGGTSADREAIMAIVQAHTMIVQEPGQTLVGPEERFNAWRRYCGLSGMPSASMYFVDPASPKGQQSMQQINQQQQEMKQKEEQSQLAMLQMQGNLAQAEVAKADAQMQNVQLKAQIEQLKLQLDQYKSESENFQKGLELKFKYDELRVNEQLKLTELEAKQKAELSKKHAQNA